MRKKLKLLLLVSHLLLISLYSVVVLPIAAMFNYNNIIINAQCTCTVHVICKDISQLNL